ncbi:MAG: hypothetical protein IID40_06210 [Planctomycetes bacterium]|nr:hypothetical protein [Planctomycetota bacterium]
MATASPQGSRISARRAASARAWAIGLIGALALVRSAAAQPVAEPDTHRDLRRVIHRFDFDERQRGNFEPAPMHWRSVEADGFPGFAPAGFDDRVGHQAPPSFRLGLDGRNVAQWYNGPATPVRPNSEYLITGWVRADRLISARAALSAYYLDRHSLPLDGTQVFSRLVGSEQPPSGETESWQQVKIHLPAAPPEAQTIGLTIWGVQASIWDLRPRPHRNIESHDIDAGAWFDDIVIYRMPSVTLTTTAPGGIFETPQVPTLVVAVADADAIGLSANLTVRSVIGLTISDARVPVQTGATAHPMRLPLGGLEPGLYEATLTITTGGDQSSTHRVRFVQLAPRLHSNLGVAAPFGIVLDARNRAAPYVEGRLLETLSVGAVKVPVWSPLATHDLEGSAGDTLLHGLVKAGVSLTGVLSEPPPGLVASAGAYARPLLEILSDDPEGWQPHLASVAAQYSSIFRNWQIGADDDPVVASNPALADVLRSVRREMVSLITTVSLAVPGQAALAPGSEALPAEEITLGFADDIHSDWMRRYLDDYRGLGYERISAYVGHDPNHPYARLPQLGEFARRIIRARHAGMATVYAPQLWRTRSTLAGELTEPTEALIVYRTIVHALHDLAPGPVVELAAGVQALAFHDLDRSVLALWDPSAPPEGREYTFQFGSAERQIDLWGRVTPLTNSQDGRRRVRLYNQPIFVDGIERWLIEFASTVTLNPARSEMSLLPQTHRIGFSNSGPRPLSASVTIEAPRGWGVRPRRFALRLSPGASHQQPVEFRYARNEPAGPKLIRAIVDLESEPKYHFVIPLTLELGIDNVDVWGFTFLEGDRLVLRHGITNRTQQPLSFRSSATAPGHSRQFRVITGLAPGETTTAEYRFRNAAELTGRTVRLGLREIDGPRTHTIELTAP